MVNTKKDKLQTIKKMFLKKKVLKIEDFSKALGTKSRMTIYRYMKEIDYLTSYSHKAQYYTLKEIAKFDTHGLWFYGDIGFSKHGTLYNTITYFVEHSKEGMTGNELKTESRTEVKYALLDLIEKENLSRSKPSKVYVYLSSDPAKAEKQLLRRKNIPVEQAVDQETSFRVLLAAYKFISERPSPEQVASHLKNEGSKISLNIVRQVFQHYGLEKKT